MHCSDCFWIFHHYDFAVTGATGFVMSVLAHQWLESYPDERVIVLDGVRRRTRQRSVTLPR